MTQISPHAVIEHGAQIGTNVTIGPFCHIGPSVQIGDGSILRNNVTVVGHTRLGEHNVFYQNAVIGEAPQDLKYQGQPTETIIGSRNVFRENVTVHRGTELGGGRTVIGNANLFMVGTHIAHDCLLADHIILANQTQLAGHVCIEQGASIMALVGIHHFVTVGQFSYVGGMTPVHRDVPPFMKFSGDPNEVRAVNEEGLKRHDFTAADIAALKRAYRQLFRNNCSIAESLDQLKTQPDHNPHVAYLCDFMLKSCQGRFGRYLEANRRDTHADRRHRTPAEVRDD